MRRLFPPTLLEWREPEPVRRWRDARLSKSVGPWTRPILILLFLAGTTPSWFVLRELADGPPRPLWAYAAVLLAFGIGICCGLPVLSARFPSRIWITAAVVHRLTGLNSSHLRRNDGSTWSLEIRDFDGLPTRVLVNRRPSGAETVVGIAPEVTEERLRSLLIK
jgi:hypothetical protein